MVARAGLGLLFLFLYLFLMEDKIKKEMLLRMIMRCNKMRKHKPKRSKSPALTVGVYESVEFPESGIKKKRHYSSSETSEIRRNLQNLT